MSTNWLARNYKITLFQFSDMYLLHCAIFISSLLEIMTRFSFSKYEEAILSEKSRTSWFHTPLIHSNVLKNLMLQYRSKSTNMLLSVAMYS